ncbi:MAG: hypothetical protein DRQ40_08065 [Gammaproteobacteria bacterium]|nr:MAG: hypothetical protein DRQ40_08065 [Gammaproteobacteria bacterium]
MQPHFQRPPPLLHRVDHEAPLLVERDQAAEVEPETAAESAAGTGASMTVDEPGLGQIDHLESALPHAVAPVHVLEVEEKALVHGTTTIEGVAPHQ